MKIIDKKSKMSLIKFISDHDELRLWQAISRWAKVNFILTSTHFDHQMFDKEFLKKYKVQVQDTFYK